MRTCNYWPVDRRAASC